MQERADGVASVTFAAGSAGPFLNEIIVHYASIAEAANTVAQFEQVPRSCGTIHTAFGGYQLDVSISSQSFPTYGDQSAALGVQLTFAGTTLSVDAQLAVVQHGATVIALMNMGIPLDTGLTSQVMTIAYRDVASRW